MVGLLQVVATPIGNLDDLTPRASEALRTADIVLCEDTRHSARLLALVGSKARAVSMHAHNEDGRLPMVLDALAAGRRVAMVSDAGTPCLSDPGARLVAAVHEAGFPVHTLPGPFAAAAAIAASGLTPTPFAFWGFLPKKSAARQAALRLRLTPGPDDGAMTHAFYVPGRDLAAVMVDLATVAADANVVIARELTKIHEGYLRGRADGLVVPEEMLRGEAVVLVEVRKALAAADDGNDIDAALRLILVAADRKDALRALARTTGRSRRGLYQRLLAMEAEGADAPAAVVAPTPRFDASDP